MLNHRTVKCSYSFLPLFFLLDLRIEKKKSSTTLSIFTKVCRRIFLYAKLHDMSALQIFFLRVLDLRVLQIK